jgi:hypothetical protein
MILQGVQSPIHGISHTHDMVYVNEKPPTHPTLGISAAICSALSFTTRSYFVRNCSEISYFVHLLFVIKLIWQNIPKQSHNYLLS